MINSWGNYFDQFLGRLDKKRMCSMANCRRSTAKSCKISCSASQHSTIPSPCGVVCIQGGTPKCLFINFLYNKSFLFPLRWVEERELEWFWEQTPLAFCLIIIVIFYRTNPPISLILVWENSIIQEMEEPEHRAKALKRGDTLLLKFNEPFS